MASNNYVHPSIPHFDGHHYDHWSMLIENFLRSKKYWTVVEAGVLEPMAGANDAQRAKIEKEKLKDLRAKNYLFQAIDWAILETILNKSTSKNIWDSMKKKPRSDRLEESSAIGIQKRWQNRNYQVADNRSKSAGKANIECSRCHKYGHYRYECRANLNRGESFSFVEHNEKNDDSSLFMQKKMVNGLPHFDSPSEICEIYMTKSKALVAFKNFKVLAENEVGRSVKVLRTDHGGEFNLKESVDFCESNGIKRQLTTAYTPQQNGVCERRNRTIMSMVQSLMSKNSLPKEFWPKAVNWSVDILNRSPTSPLPDLMPEEAWSGRRPAIDYFRIFGCREYAHVPDQKMSKLDDKGEKCIFLGVSDQSKAYRLYSPLTKKVIITRDVVFDEVSTWSWTEKSRQQIPTDFENGEYLTVQNSEVARMDTIRLMIALAAQNSWPIYQLDVKSAFLHGNPQEQVFIDQPLGYVKFGSKHKVFKSALMSRHFTSNLEMKKVLDRFQMKNCNSVTTPIHKGVKLMKDPGGRSVDNKLYKQIVGSLMYLIATRLDVMHGVSLISRYMEHPKELHLQTAKRILRYLCGTIDFGLFYKKGDQIDLAGLIDNDYSGDLDDKKSTSWFVFMLGSGAISWSSKKQPIVTLSTTEAEYVATTSCSCQVIWLRRIMEELELNQHEATSIYCDNSLAIKLSRNPILHGRSKRIHVRYTFLHNLVEDGTIELIYRRIEDQVVDIFTKPLKVATFLKLRELLGVCSM
ncbi:hypothetical protein SLEP1_g9499 [Rubroshorea leprosula]|uniref:Integrase catalytic domain-containing protein n=1 Tax=Rubroshorea leprosula TaxID=152421 RepID=A0AAV5ID26_9ROSI|nr:hypothetical protein SLEP1_g9499 [Rubroshorea leprosula]